MWWLIRRCAGHQSTKQKQQFVEKIVYGSLSSQAAVVDMRVPEESGRMVTAGSLCIEQRCLAVAWCLACSQVYSLHGLQSSNEDALSHSDIAGDVEGCARRAWPCLLPQSVKEPVQSRKHSGTLCGAHRVLWCVRGGTFLRSTYGAQAHVTYEGLAGKSSKDSVRTWDDLLAGAERGRCRDSQISRGRQKPGGRRGTWLLNVQMTTPGAKELSGYTLAEC